MTIDPPERRLLIAPQVDHAAAVATSIAAQTPPADAPVTTLRGATVNVDGRRAGLVVTWILLVGVTITGIALLIAGIQNNSQVNSLRSHGVPVTVHVTGCLGLIGGTGGQLAGYSCTGAYALDGTHYRQTIPGLGFHAPGTSFEGIAVPGDPKLLSTPAQLAGQHTSAKVFIVPVLLLLFVAVMVGLLCVRRRSRRSGGRVAAGSGADGAGAGEAR